MTLTLQELAEMHPSHLDVIADDIGLKAGDLVIDVGGFKGEEVIACRRRKVRVLSFEPNPDHYQYMRSHSSLAPNVHISLAAAGVAYGSALLYQQPEGVGYESGSTLMSDKLGDFRVFCEVPTVDITDIVFARKIKLLKIDAEGMEYALIERILNTCGFGDIEHLYFEDHERCFPTSEWIDHKRSVLKRMRAQGVTYEPWV